MSDCTNECTCEFTESEEILGEICCLANFLQLDPESEDGKWIIGLMHEQYEAGDWKADEATMAKMQSLRDKMADEAGIPAEAV